MSYHLLQSPNAMRQQAWKTYLRTLLEGMQIQDPLPIEHLLFSVALYCQEHYPHGLQEKDAKLLIARALCSLHLRSEATQLIQSMSPHARHPERWLEILTELHQFPKLLPFFSAGILHPADWVGAQVERMWVLDFSKIHISDSERHEILLYRTVRLLIEQTAPIWDSVSGHGVLGIRGLENMHLPPSRYRKRLPPERIPDYIRRLVQHLQLQRTWEEPPMLITLKK